MGNMFDIQGQKAIVTGGTRGLGRGMAEALLEAGCEVVIVGSSAKVAETAAGFREKGYICSAVQADLGKKGELYAAFRSCMEKLGDLDILVTAHGITYRHQPEEYPISEWDEVINVNLNSVFYLCQEAGKVMLKKGYGKIIDISSMNAFFGGSVAPAYSASKGGISQLTKALSNDWAGKGINVNAIAPGFMATDLTAALWDPNNPRCKEITDRIPSHRWGTPDDMKGITVFLASHASDYISGAMIPVDGGYLVK